MTDGSEKSLFSLPDVQSDVLSPSRMHITVDQHCTGKHFLLLLFKSKVSKSEGHGKLNRHVIFGSVMMLFTKIYQNYSVLVETIYSLPKWCVFIETQYGAK